MRMTGNLSGPNFSFECRIVDIRELDGERLLKSDRIEDNVIAILARVNEPSDAVKRILGRIAASDPAQRGRMLAGFLTLGGLRKLEEVIEQEVRQMPILDDIMDHKVLGREFKRGLAQGQEQGLEKGLKEGRRDGELAVLLRQIEKRFGTIPAALRSRLEKMSAAELEAVALRVLDIHNVEELLG